MKGKKGSEKRLKLIKKFHDFEVNFNQLKGNVEL